MSPILDAMNAQRPFSLEYLINGLRVAVEPFAVCDIGDDAMADLPQSEHPTLHYVIRGRGRIEMPSLNRAVPLHEHDIVIAPAGVTQHVLPFGADSATPAQEPICRPIVEGFDRVSIGDSCRRLLMVCAVADVSHRSGLRPLHHLKAPIAATPGIAESLGQLLDLMLEELSRAGPASKSLAESFLQQCVAQVLLSQAKGDSTTLPILAALSDTRLSRAVATVLGNPSGIYSLESLADIAGMSRSSFAEHFGQVVGLGPIAFLKGMRLSQASRLLLESDLPVKRIAAKVGYRSRSSFSRAFKAEFGLDPASYREQKRTQPLLQK